MDYYQTDLILRPTVSSFRSTFSVSIQTSNPRSLFKAARLTFLEESIKSNESDDMQRRGCVFGRVRVLEYRGGEFENLMSYEDAADGTWLPTEFIVVVLLMESV
ncbi:MAG: hypothetical protein M1840_003622 [Geoglossum simile]|nr:MAG: hypothetical protein M1840_003622 [Geoglossum simile]